MLTLITWLKQYLSGFLTVQFLFPPLSILYSGKVTKGTPHLSRKLCSIFLRTNYKHKLFGIILHGRFVSSPPLFIHSVIYIRTHRYLFHTLDHTIIQLYSFCCSNHSNFSQLQLFQFIPVTLTYPHHCGLVSFCFCFSTSILSDLTRCKHILDFLVPLLESAFSPRSLGSFYWFCWRMVPETTIWILGVLLATADSLADSVKKHTCLY